MQESGFQHQLYKHCNNSKEADACAWVFNESGSMERVYFNFPELKEDEIRINVKYSGLCQSDTTLVRNKHFPIKRPFCPGHEVFGVVSHIGKGVKRVKVGDRVGYGPFGKTCQKCDYCSTQNENLCKSVFILEKYLASVRWGGYSTSMQQTEQFAYKIPDGIPDEHVAPLMCAGQTVFAPILEYLKPGMKVAVLGIGGLGHLALQFAKAYGAGEVVAVTGSIDDKKDLIYKLGATEIVDIKSKEQLVKNEGRFHLVLNTIANCSKDIYPLLINLTASLGNFCVIGAPDSDDFTISVPCLTLVRKVNVVGVAAGSILQTEKMLEFAAKHKIFPMSENFSFDDFPKAFERMEKGKPLFRVQVNIGEWAKQNNFLK